MAIQQRAELTRQRILSAAAQVFDRDGYERTSLGAIGAEAKLTTGALAFHFRTKSHLAEAVRQRARSVTRRAIEAADERSETPIQKLVTTTDSLIQLFETEAVARAGERLARELEPGETADLSCPWRREVARLVRAADRGGMLRSGADATAVTALICYVVTGVELAMRSPSARGDEQWLGAAGALDGPPRERLERIWGLVLPGLVPEGGCQPA